MRKALASILLTFLMLLGCAAIVLNSQHLSVDAATQHSSKDNIRVWVNTKSGVYHCPGTRWYGATKEGEYMTQKQAQDKNYRPAYNRPCQ